MDTLDLEAKMNARSQMISLVMIFWGSLCTWVGCHFHYAELTTLAAGITGAGIQMMTSQIKNTLNNRSGGTVNLAPVPPADPAQLTS